MLAITSLTLCAGWESSGLAGLVQRAALDFLWGGGWQELVMERVTADNVTAGNATAGGVAGLSLKPVAFPQNRALNARFAGGSLRRAKVCQPPPGS